MTVLYIFTWRRMASLLIIKITISSIVIILKNSYFFTNALAKLLSDSLLLDSSLEVVVNGQFNKPITFKVVV